MIDRAAKLVGQKLTGFVLDAARHSAEDALLDRTAFVVSPNAYAEFLAASMLGPSRMNVCVEACKHPQAKLSQSVHQHQIVIFMIDLAI